MVKNQNIDAKLSIQDYILIFIVILLKMGFFIIVPLIRLIKTLQKDKWDDGTTQITKRFVRKPPSHTFSLFSAFAWLYCTTKKIFCKTRMP